MRKVAKKKTNFATITGIFLAIVFILGIALLRVHLCALIDNLKYTIGEKMDREEELLKERENLKRELYSLKSPSRIEKEGFRLGMSYPRSWQIKEITIDGIN
jgi:hypothetical protein